MSSDVCRNTTGLLWHRHQHTLNRKIVFRVSDWPMRGREAELGHIACSLDTVVRASGQGAVVLIEGARGSGKSRLLAETARMAAERGFEVMKAKANELLRLAPLAVLCAALGEPQPVVGETDHAFDELDDWWSRQLAQLRGRLARRRPSLIALDDLQWADTVSLLALRVLPTQLAGYPILWVLGRCTDDQDRRAAQLYGQLGSSNLATSIELGPLDAPAADEMVADLLGARPSPEVRSLVAAADGNPAMLAVLVDGLVHEGMAVCSDGTAWLVNRGAGGDTAVAPQRFRVLVQQRIDALSPSTARMLEVAAVLGRSWLPDDVVEMLGTSTAELLFSFQEALAARLLVSTSDTMAFRHDLVWRSIIESIPPPVRAALHRQAARMLHDRGSSIVSVAVHLACGAHPQDVEAVRVLRDAAVEVMDSMPRTAIEFASRGLELMDCTDSVWLELTAVLVEALTRVGALERAIKLAREALRIGSATALPQWLSTALLLNGDTRESLAVAGRAISATAPDRCKITAEARGVLELNRLAALALLDDSALEDAVEDAAAWCGGDHVGVLTVLATARWHQGRFTEGLHLARDAVRAAAGGTSFPWHLDPRVVFAAMLIQSRQEDEARAMLAALEAHVVRSGLDVLAAIPNLLHAQLHLARGELDEAKVRAEAALAEPVTAYTPIASAVLAVVAMRRGDIVAAGEHARELARQRPALWRGQASWIHAKVTGQEQEELPGPAVLVEEPAAAAWFVRTALAAGDEDRAAAVLRRMIHAGDTVAFDHARGVHERDQAALARAAEHHVDGWARASAAEDLAVLLTTSDRDTAVERLDQALAGYRAAGAERDAARVRRRLRGLGVRRRHWRNVNRPVSGWDSLTDAERSVAALVIQGFTNKRVATQMFLSPHTVGFHLRQIFRKLGIHSRTELARFGPDPGSTR
jgi:DNA-binding CsgD family transcriptional regulator